MTQSLHINAQLHEQTTSKLLTTLWQGGTLGWLIVMTQKDGSGCQTDNLELGAQKGPSSFKILKRISVYRVFKKHDWL